MIEEGVDRMKTDAGEAPLIAVGGGSFLVPRAPRRRLRGPQRAASGGRQRGGRRDRPGERRGRPDLPGPARGTRPSPAPAGSAEDKAVAAGADRATINVVEVEDLPLAYLPGNSLRTRVRVVGDIAG